MEIVFNSFLSRISSFVRGLGSRFSGLLGLENRFENRRIFGDVTDPESGIWRGGSGPDLSPLKR